VFVAGNHDTSLEARLVTKQMFLEAGVESVTTRDSEGFPYWEGTNIDVKDYIKNLKL
jgi:hypothetical protein